MDELDANLQVGLGPDQPASFWIGLSLQHLEPSGVGRAQGSRLEGANIAGQKTTLLGTEALKHKFDRLTEKAKNSEDIRAARVRGLSSFQVASQRGRRSGVGWLGEGLSQSPPLQR